MLKYLLEKEFKLFFRNSFLPRIVIILPFAALLLFPLVANMEIKNLNLNIVDNDKSTTSTELIKKIESSGYFRITGHSSSYQEAINSVENNSADIILELPPKMEKDLMTQGRAKVLISANAINGIKAGLGSSYLASIIAPQSLTVEQYRFNPALIYRVYMIPAIMVMMLTVICGFLPALNIVGEKESGTIEQMNVTPVKRVDFILAKLIPYWVVGYVVLTLSFGVAWLVYGYLPTGNFLTIYLTASLFVPAISGFGLVISNYAKTIRQAILMIFFFVITFIFISGLYTPISSMPKWAQYLSSISPLRYTVEAFRLIYLKGSSASELVTPLAALALFSLFFYGWAVLSYSKRE